MPYYPSYQPTFYNPYLYQPQTQQTQQNTGIVWISSEREAAMYPVAPNNAVTLWNQNEPVVYLKTADATGKPTLKTYDLVERVEKPVERQAEGFATKEELAAVVGAVRDIDGVISTLAKEVDGLKKETEHE